MIYYFAFIGREVGAIGVTYPCFQQVEALSEAAARAKLYDTHEHISGLRLSSSWEVAADHHARADT